MDREKCDKANIAKCDLQDLSGAYMNVHCMIL